MNQILLNESKNLQQKVFNIRTLVAVTHPQGRMNDEKNLNRNYLLQNFDPFKNHLLLGSACVLLIIIMVNYAFSVIIFKTQF